MKHFSLIILLLAYLCYSSSAQSLTDSLLVHYTFNGNTNDQSINGYHATAFGTGFTTDRDSNQNSALFFDGVDDYLELPNIPQLEPELPVSISFWVKTETLLYEDNRWIATENVFNNYTGINVAGNSANPGRVSINFGDGGGAGPSHRRSKLSNSSITLGNWHHIAAVVRGATDMDIYIDGINAGGTYSGTGAAVIGYSSAAGEIGRIHGLTSNPTTRYFWGTMDELAIWNRALSPSEIAQVYINGVPTGGIECNSFDLKDSLLLYYTFDGNAADQSGNGQHATAFGTTLINDRFGNPNSAFYFDGIDDYLQLPNTQKLKPNLPVTISFWIKAESLLYEDNRWIATENVYNNYTGYNVAISSQNPGFVTTNFGDGGGAGPGFRRSKQSGSAISVGDWHHICAVIRGSNDMDIYINCINAGGSYSGSGDSSVAHTTAHGEVGRIHGLTANPTTRYFWGAMDNLAIWNRALTHAEVLQLCSDCIGLLQMTSVKSNVSCSGSANGSARVVPTGGKAPYYYLWSNGETTDNISQLTPGEYTVSVSDANRCCTSKTITISSPPPILQFGVVQNPSASGAMDGSINLLVTGGVNPYNYSWSNGATTEDVMGLPGGFYFVTTADWNGCAKIKTFVLIDP